MSSPPVRGIAELTPEDLHASPIWEFTFKEKTSDVNAGEVRARPDLQAYDPRRDPGLILVRATFILADGASMVGHFRPRSPGSKPPEHLLGYLAPAIVCEKGSVPFWFAVDNEPVRDDIADYYDLLEKKPSAVFPIRFTSDVPVQASEFITSGDIEAFSFIVFRNSKFFVSQIR